MDRASLEQFLARGLSLEAIGRRLGRHESTVAYWVDKYGLVPAGRERHAARGALAPEELGRLVESGCSIAEIALAVDRSKATVRHWLARYNLKTGSGRGRRPPAGARAAKEAGLAAVRMRCLHHGDADFVVDGRGVYRCKRCRSAAVARRRRKVKSTLVAEAGGACAICGYARHMRGLHFHHVQPTEKRLEINARGASLSIARLRAEAEKCVLLCSNCHAEVEAGITRVPSRIPARIQSPSDPASHPG